MVYRINAGTNAIHYGVVDCVLFFQNLLADKKNWEVGPNISKKKQKNSQTLIPYILSLK